MIPEPIKGRKFKHGHGGGGKCTAEYTAWSNMKARCFNKTHTWYKNYGGRGITVCERWVNSFVNFINDMGKKPSPFHTLDRYPNNNGNYEPGNCRWATRGEQNLNQRLRVEITHNGITKSARQWARELGVSKSTVMCRWRSGRDITKNYLRIKNKL